MTSGGETVAVVLARSGSRGLPGKNEMTIAGRPMICHTITHALEAETIRRIIVSTDGDGIAAAAESMGDDRVEVLHRPSELATDRSPVVEAARHAVAGTPGALRYVVILYANVPRRPYGLIDRAVRLLAASGADSVQVVAHCFGSTTFFMAMLSGLQGVRSAAISQIATHMKVQALSRLKAGLHIHSVLDAVGVDSLTAYTDAHASWLERLYDNALRLYPVEFEERTNSPVDRRITFMYGQLWELDQLNTATHDNLHEMFGVANIRCFEHLARMVRVGRLVDFEGRDVYLPHLDRLAIPITIVHGAENATFLPESTELTYKLLRERNGPDLYSRQVIPRYGHIDCIFGKNAGKDVYPYILGHLDKTA